MVRNTTNRGGAEGSSCGFLVSKYERCLILRNEQGGYLVHHDAFPEGQWNAANLPAAHALCSSLGRRAEPDG